MTANVDCCVLILLGELRRSHLHRSHADSGIRMFCDRFPSKLLVDTSESRERKRTSHCILMIAKSRQDKAILPVQGDAKDMYTLLADQRRRPL